MMLMAPTETSESAGSLCWHCHQTSSGDPLCSHCATIQPVGVEVDYFSLLGLKAKKMRLEPESLEKTFYALSRQVHPDRYQNRSPKEREIAEERSAMVNVAYRTLRDPIARTEYLLTLEEGPSHEAQDQSPAGFLHEIVELEETIEAYQGSDDADRGTLENTLKEARQALGARWEALEAELHESFERWDRRVVEEGSDEAKAPLLSRFREILHHRRYLTKTIEDISDALAGEPRSGTLVD